MPRRKFFDLRSGLRISALDWGGDKPLAILCHANGFCAATWSLVAEQLQQDLRVIALDARGHGASSVPKDENFYDWGFLVEDLLEVTEQLLANAAAPSVALIAGNSLGAVIGVFGVYTSHPVLHIPLPWWVRAPAIGGWMNFVLTLFAYDQFAALIA